MEFPLRERTWHCGIIEDAEGNIVADARTPEQRTVFIEACKTLELLGYRAGYDGKWFKAGDRVELHPGTDLWMRGAKYGEVVGISLTRGDAVRVKLDASPSADPIAGTPELFRKV